MKKKGKCECCDNKNGCDCKKTSCMNKGHDCKKNCEGCECKGKCGKGHGHGSECSECSKKEKYHDKHDCKMSKKHNHCQQCDRHHKDRMKKNCNMDGRKYSRNYRDKENYMRKKYKSKKLNAYFQKIMKNDNRKSYEMLMNEVMEMTGKIIKGDYCSSDRLMLRKGIKLKVNHLRKMF